MLSLHTYVESVYWSGVEAGVESGLESGLEGWGGEWDSRRCVSTTNVFLTLAWRVECRLECSGDCREE